MNLEDMGENPQVVIAGSAWKGSPVMFGTFRDSLGETCPRVQVRKPVFVPVAGGVVCQFLKSRPMGDGETDFLKREFCRFLFREEQGTC